MTKSVGLTVLQQFKNKWGSIGLILWLPFTVFVTYQCRYWVNSDTIGSLDAARAIRELDLTFAVNGYFGSGFAVLLSALPDSNLQSFFAHHLLSTAVILLTQYTIYQTLRLLRIRTLISGLLATVWAAGMFATGPGIYLTADIILCFLSALYVYFVVKGLVLQSGETPQARTFVILAVTHGLAGITKTIAWPVFSIFFALFFSALLLRTWRADSLSWDNLRRLGGTLLAYTLPLGLLLCLWVAACYAKYDFLTLGGAAEINLEMTTNKTPDYIEARQKAQMTPPEPLSYWFSDPTLTVKTRQLLAERGADTFEPDIQFFDLNLIVSLLKNVFAIPLDRRDLTIGFALVLIILATLGAPFFVRDEKQTRYVAVWILALTGWACVILYMSTVLIARYLSLPALLCLPLLGLVLQAIAERRLIFPGRYWVYAFLFGGIFHGVATLLYASLFLAPSDFHFRAANVIRENGSGPIATYLSPFGSQRTYAVIAFLLDTSAAEMIKTSIIHDSYRADFSPRTAMLILREGEDRPPSIHVNGLPFRLAETGTWKAGTTTKKEMILLYFPENS